MDDRTNAQEQKLPTAPADAAKTLHNTALFGLVAFPALMLLPPRRLNILTIGLASGTYFSANWLYRERYGRSIPEWLSGTGPRHVETTPLGQTVVKQDIGNESKTVPEPKWVVERRVEEQEAVDEGKGIFDMMGEQVKEVFAGKEDGEK